MSIYDNFRAPQYVDFAGILSSDISTDASSFFDRDTDMDLTPSVQGSFRGSSKSSSNETISDKDSCMSSSNETISDNDTTLTPTRFNTSIAGNLDANRDCGDRKVSLTPYGTKCFQVASSLLSNKPGKLNITPADAAEDSPIEFDIPSHRESTPMIHHTQVSSKTASYGSPPRKSIRFEERNSSASEVSSPSVIGKSPKPISADSLGIEKSVSRKSRCSAAPSINRRSRSASNTRIISDEEILNDAIRSLSIGSSSQKKTKTGVLHEVDQLSSPGQLVPVIVATPKEISKKTQQSTVKGGGPKRKFSPPPKNSRDYSQQPAKYISLAEQIALVQKQTPKRFRTLPSAAALKRGVQSKVARNLSVQPKLAPSSSSGSASTHSVAQKKGKEQEGLGDNKGVRVARWPQPKVEPFVLKKYQKAELPKTVFNFEQKGSVLLRDRKTPVKNVRKNTTVQPFSFDKRDQEILQRKISRTMGVETQSHCYHSKARRRSKSQGDEHCTNSVKHDPLVHHARVPTVLHKPPFVPQKKPHKATRPMDLCLFTERRAKEREEFDKCVNQKKMNYQLLLSQHQEEKRRQEERELWKLRKEIVHKARPAPQFQPFIVHRSVAPLTDPLSPSFLHRSNPIRSRSSDEHMES